jgi:murein DD-endopeptidase MepM/ murein hydrolase activator NlpD
MRLLPGRDEWVYRRPPVRGPAGFAAAACAAAACALTACGVEYRPARSGADSARAVAAADSARRAAGPVDTVTRVDTVVRVDTVRVRDTLPALGVAPAGAADSFRVARRPDAPAAAASPAAPPNVSGALPAAPAAPAPARADTAPPVVTAADRAALAERGLRVPVQGVTPARVPDTFAERRDGGSRPHEALDILAPRGTPVLSASDGRVLKLFTSAAGGLAVYVLDPSGRFVCYYAHLDAYRPGLAEGQAVRAGDPLGTVGSTGNANAAAPHLHFAVARLDDPRRWWAGTPVDPKPYLR